MKVFVKENSWVAKIAARKLSADACAIVIGSTIHLHNASKQELLTNTSWLRHEVCHVKQWNQKTYALYPLLYVWHSIMHGYKNNPYEVEARDAAFNESILDGIIFE